MLYLVSTINKNLKTREEAMEEITIRKALGDIEKAKLIGEIEKAIDQHDNDRIELWMLNKKIIASECGGGGHRDYLLSREEAKEALADPDEFLSSMAYDWAANEEDPELAAIQWGGEETYSGNKTCKIVVKKNYYGYTPIDYLRDRNMDIIYFENSQAAQGWIDEEEGKSPYYLDQNEAGRPTYLIIED